MEIHAYDELYLSDAQNILGHAVDFAVMTLDIDPDAFGTAFAVSSVSKQFAAGNPSYVAGINGCELARLVLTEIHLPLPDAEDAMYLDKTPEYWSGWALAWYQWYSNCSFMDILTAVPLSQIINLYPLYHEMDLTHFADFMQQQLKAANPYPNLRKYRNLSGLSQTQLAYDSGVPLRQIQLFEQRQRDINKTSAATLFRLSKSLHCRMEDLLDFSSSI